MPLSQDDIRFVATLDDQVSPQALKLEERLRHLGATENEIRMMLRAYDEATPKIKEAQKHMRSLPKEHRIDVQAKTEKALMAIGHMQAQMAAPVETGLNASLKESKQHLTDIANQMFNLRSRVSLPMGMVPGANQLIGVGAGAGIAGVATAGIGLVGQGVAVNSRMEQSLITLTQTLKDQSKATAEMGKIVEIAQKTPFQYEDVLQADVRLRSYNIPTMPGEGGPGNQGWMKSAGDMAAAMGTPINQAVEAIADARQGYFVRMMSYGIRMMKEDFSAGGKFAGLTYEQGLERAIRRFDGAQEAQSKSLQGLTSNLKDIVEQRIIAPIGAPMFNKLREGAQSVQDRVLGDSPQAFQFQQNLGQQVEKVQAAFVSMFQVVQEGKQYFEQNLREPLQQISKDVVRVGADFTKVFGGTLFEALKAVGTVFMGLARPISGFLAAHPGLVAMVASFKALSLLGFTGVTKGLGTMLGALNPMHASVFRLIGGFRQLTRGAIALGIAAIAVNLLNAERAANKFENALKSHSKGAIDDLRELNAQIAKVSGGLDVSSAKLKNLTADALGGLEGGKGRTAIYQGSMAAALERDYGIDKDVANKLMIDEKITGKKDIQEAGLSLAKLKRVTDEFGISMKDAARIMNQFKEQANAVGLGGLDGARQLVALNQTASRSGFLSQADMDAGIYTGTAFINRMFEQYTKPSASALEAVRGSGRGIDEMYNVNREYYGRLDLGQNARSRDPRGPLFEEALQIDDVRQQRNTVLANRSALREQRRSVNAITDEAGMSERLQLPNFTDRNLANQLPDIDKILSGVNTAKEAVNALTDAWIKNEDVLRNIAGEVDNYQSNINELNKTINTITLAQQSLALQISDFQHSLVPLQHKIEDANAALQEWSAINMRPLEREMTRLGNVSARYANQMSNAQWEMNKFNSGLFTGEQAVLNQLHALERYNRQLNILQMQYQMIGADLGTQTYDEGARVRVEPMSLFNLQWQMERNQRKSALEQAKADENFGEKRYQLQQAARPENERTERSFQERMEGVRRNVPIIDSVTRAQHSMSNEQYQLQVRMSRANEYIQDQQDAIGKLQRKLTDKQLHGGLREMVEAQYQFGRNAELANIQLNAQNILLAAAQDKMTTFRDVSERLGGFVQNLLDPKTMDPDGVLAQLTQFAQIVGIASPGQASQIRRDQARGETVAAKEKKTPDVNQSLIDAIKQGIWGAFTGDFMGRLADRLHLPKIANGIFTALGTAGIVGGTALVGGGLLRLGARRWIGATRLGQVPGIRAWSRMGTIGEQFRLIMRGRAVLGAGGGAVLGGLLTGGNPLGAILGGYLGGRWGERTPFRRWPGSRVFRWPIRAARMGGRGLGRFVRGLDRGLTKFREIMRGQSGSTMLFTEGAGKVHDAAQRIARGARRFTSAVGRIRLRGAGVFAAAVAIFEKSTGKIGKLLDKLLPDKLPQGAKIPDIESKKATQAAQAAEAASGTADDAARAAAAARAAGATGKAGKWSKRLSRFSAAVGIGTTGAKLAEGDAAGAAENASYFLPYMWQGAVYHDVLKQFGFKDGDEGPGRTELQKRRETARDRAMTQTQLTRALSTISPFESTRQGADLAKKEVDRMNITLNEARKIYARGGKLPQVLNDYFHHLENVHVTLTDKQKRRVAKAADDEVAITDGKVKDRNKKEDQGFNRLRNLTDSHTAAIRRKIKKFREDMGLTGDTPNISVRDVDSSGPNSTGGGADSMAQGGRFNFGGKTIKGVGDGKGRLYWAGEEDDELVIPLAGHRRERARSLVKQAAGIIGLGAPALANGGDPAYEVAKREYGRAAQNFANGGKIVPIPWAPGEEINSRILGTVTKLHRRFGVGVSDAFDRDRSANHKSPGHNVTGTAVDFTGTPAQLNALVAWAVKNKFTTYYDGSLGSTALANHGPNHHAHVEFGSTGGNVTVGRASSTGGPPWPGTPRKFKEMGAVGRAMFEMFAKMRRRHGTSTTSASASWGGDDVPIPEAGSARRIIAEAARSVGIPAKYLWGVFGAESNFGRIQKAVSSAGAQGPFQFMPGTADAYVPGGRKNVWSLRHAAVGAAKYLDYLHGLFKSWPEAIGHYNSGPGGNLTNPETAAYIPKVLQYAKSFATGTPGYRVNAPEELLRVHQGERVRVDNPAKASSKYDDQTLAELIKIRKQLERSEDNEEKRANKRDLAAVNAELRQRWAAKQASSSAADRRTARAVRMTGDETDGEATLAGVKSEKKRFEVIIKQELKRNPLVRRAGRLRRSARSLLRTARTPRQRRLATRAVRLSGRAVSSARRFARGRARVRQIGGMARRGVSARLVRNVTGRGLTRGQQRLYRRAANAVTRSRRPGAGAKEAKAARDAMRKLNTSLNRGLSGLRREAKSDASKARKAVVAAARAQGKRIDRNGNIVGKATSKASARTAREIARSSNKTLAHASKEGSKQRAAVRDNSKETRKVNETTKKADAKRERAEANADKRERQFQQRSLKLLEKIAERDLNVNIHNEAKGAKLTSTIIKTKFRPR